MTGSAGDHATPGLSLAFRLITPEDDMDFLYTVYDSTRTDERMGFRRLGEHGVYYFMGWSIDPPIQG